MSMIIGVDFDGTVVDHRYPDIGKPVPGAISWLKEFQGLGVRLMLWTMRGGVYLEDAIQYCRENGIEFWAHNENPEQNEWTKSNKQYAHIYIDDSAFGCPLIKPEGFKRWSFAGHTATRARSSSTDVTCSSPQKCCTTCRICTQFQQRPRSPLHHEQPPHLQVPDHDH